MIRNSLQTRIATIVALIAVAFSAAGYVINRRFFYDEFVALERQEAIDDLARCDDAVRREIHHLAIWCGDWSAWDDTYTFVGDGNEAFATENITDESMKNTRCNAMWFVRADGEVVRHKTFDFSGDRTLTFPELPAEKFPAGHPLLPANGLTEGVSGIIRTAHGPLLFASRPVIHSDLTGPAAGWFICGRLLGPDAVRVLAEQTHVRFNAWDVDDRGMPPGAFAAAHDATRRGRPFIDDRAEDLLHATGTLDDIFGRPAVVVTADVPRDISRQGAQSMQIATLSTAVAGCVTVAALLVLLSMTVVSPLRRLTRHAEAIGRSGDLATRSGISRNDEIGLLATEFDGMVAKLAESRVLLADTARRAGMADVARGVLHNVGNVLTSVNVSAVNIVGALRQSRAEGLAKGLDLLGERRADLARFLTEDARGKMLPEYLAKAAVALREERAGMLAEAEKLQNSVAHVADIVARQGEFASAQTAPERAPLEDIVGSAVALVEPAYVRHSITLMRHVDANAVVTLDRTRLTQVLVNLLTNAKEALADREASQRRVNLGASVAGGRIRISVQDNGCGLRPEDAARIFERGFSTKKDGRGFGLHYCAVTAQEMGGVLRMTSDGPGLGATFTLDLPETSAASAQAPSRAEKLPAEQPSSKALAGSPA